MLAQNLWKFWVAACAMRGRHKGYNPRALAALCGFDPTYISQLERGKRNPPFPDDLSDLPRHLDCALEALVRGIVLDKGLLDRTHQEKLTRPNFIHSKLKQVTLSHRGACARSQPGWPARRDALPRIPRFE